MDRAPIAPRLAAPRPRLRRLFPLRAEKRSSVPARTIWALSAWIGLMSGLAESLLRLGWRHFGPRVSAVDLWVHWQSPWMGPASMACWFLALGIAASLVRVALPRLVHRFGPPALIALGTWSTLRAISGLAPWAVAAVVAGVTVRLGPRARFDAPGLRTVAWRGLPWASGLWLVLAITTGLWPASAEWRARTLGASPPAGAPNVLLVVLDTVRADNLGLYGYGRPTSPNLDRLAARGVRFDAARATAPYTLGTHASLFTGRWMSETSVRVDAPLDGALPTLAERLRDRGYATAGFVGNIFYGSAHYGLDRGFTRYQDVPGDVTRRVTAREFLRSCGLGDALVTHFERKWRILAPMQKRRYDAGEVGRDALAWLDGPSRGDRPFFLFLNLFDAHGPYALPADAPVGFARRSPERVEALSKRLRALEDDRTAPDTPARRAEIADLRAEVHAGLRDLYDDGIAWADRKLGEFLAELDRRGVRDNTLVIVTSDHGEMLGEHGLVGHGDSLHRPVVHVPLIVAGAKGMPVPRGASVARPVSLRSVPATVAGLLGDRSAPFRGPSLQSAWEGRGDAGAVLSEMDHMSWLPRTPRMPVAYGPMWMLTEGRWSYHRQAHETRGRVERLYDLANDPGEDADLAADPGRGAILAGLRGRMDEALGRR